MELPPKAPVTNLPAIKDQVFQQKPWNIGPNVDPTKDANSRGFLPNLSLKNPIIDKLINCAIEYDENVMPCSNVEEP